MLKKFIRAVLIKGFIIHCLFSRDVSAPRHLLFLIKDFIILNKAIAVLHLVYMLFIAHFPIIDLKTKDTTHDGAIAGIYFMLLIYTYMS